MGVKRLKVVSGEVVDPRPPGAEESKDRVVRRAVLIHAGPSGEPVTLESSDGPLSFDDARIQSVVDSQNDLIDKLAAHYGSFEKIPVGAFPPILDQHEEDSMDRVIGRLTGRLTFERRAVPKVGDDVACALSDITWLGAGTVERVADGRIFHLSIRIDEDSDTLTEVSAVIDPAAPGAMILKKGKAKAPAHIPKGVKMDPKKLQARADRRKKLAGVAGDLKKLSAKLVTEKGEARKEHAVATATKRLAAVVKSGRMTPAEFKKLDIKKLAAGSPEVLEARLETYEGREVQVPLGQRGTANALPLTDVGGSLEKKQSKRLKAEIRGDFKRLGVKMKADPNETAEPKKLADEPKVEPEKKLEGEGAVDLPADVTEQTAAVSGRLDELETQISRIAGVVSDLVDDMNAEDEEKAAEPAAEPKVEKAAENDDGKEDDEKDEDEE